MVKANFGEFSFPRNQMNKGKKKGRGYPDGITPTRLRSATPAAMEQRSSIYVAAGLLHKGFGAYPSSSTVIAICLQNGTFKSGAEGLRTPGLRRAKAVRSSRGGSPPFGKAPKSA